MAVQVTNKRDFTLPIEVSDHSLDMPVDRVQCLGWDFPPSVQILAGQRTPVVAVDDSVWVEHGHDLEHEILPQGLRLRRVADQEFYNSFHHPAGI